MLLRIIKIKVAVAQLLIVLKNKFSLAVRPKDYKCVGQ